MGKRERDDPCAICGHYHNYEEGEACGICGHRLTDKLFSKGESFISVFPSEILPDFLYLGCYDQASHSELVKAQGISHILNTVPSSANLSKNFFTYYCFQMEQNSSFEDAFLFLDKCEEAKGRVLVHCMSGNSRSAALVIAYLMKRKGWRLAQSYEWVKERRPAIHLSPAFSQQLQEFEQKVFGYVNLVSDKPFTFGFPKIDDANLAPAFGNLTTKSIFDDPALNIPPHEFIFGAGTNNKIPNNPFDVTPTNGNDGQMEN
ncbi:hypothetical protein AQUCO_03200109v1 [Aquilegia coerulea]|uniref:Tyrosine-protein phosphatase domain-containing protein n=1 Tax=Aquilegia coerulea TaxID=218851 RepID=A0A2G5D080_AQUCA|nr:hypothetical protein AQUCO_03200109v1 [Aquilegia coerulea]